MLFAGLIWSNCLSLLGAACGMCIKRKQLGTTCHLALALLVTGAMEIGLVWTVGWPGKVLPAISLCSHMWAVQRSEGSALSTSVGGGRSRICSENRQALLYCYAVKSYNHFAFYLCAFEPDKLFLCLLLSQCQLLQVSYNWKYEALKTLKFYRCSMLVVQDFFFLT